MASTLDLLQELNHAVEHRDFGTLRGRVHPDVVWLHNIGVGSPEEGEYRGRDDVIALFGRIVEPWESMRAIPTDVREVADGALVVEGELHAKHSGADSELVTPYVQRLEFEDGLLARGEMVTGPGASLPGPGTA